MIWVNISSGMGLWPDTRQQIPEPSYHQWDSMELMKDKIYRLCSIYKFIRWVKNNLLQFAQLPEASEFRNSWLAVQHWYCVWSRDVSLILLCVGYGRGGQIPISVRVQRLFHVFAMVKEVVVGTVWRQVAMEVKLISIPVWTSNPVLVKVWDKMTYAPLKFGYG